jgi:hypothetical protein
MSKNKIQTQIEVINKIYQEYFDELLNLQRQQNEIIKEFDEALRQEKLAELREKIKNIYHGKS